MNILKSFRLIMLFAAIGCAASSMAVNSNKTNMQQQEVNYNDAYVLLSTNMGDIKVRLYGITPIHRDNFVKLAKEGYYDGTLFHRVINNFMIQGGDGTSKSATKGQMLGEGDPGYTLPAEIKYPTVFHRRGALAAARMGDNVNPEYRSSGSQFYIVTGRQFNDSTLSAVERRRPASVAPSTEYIREVYKTDGGTPHLDGSYTVFGEVVEGMDVVDAIQKVETDNADRPREDVRIISAKVIE